MGISANFDSCAKNIHSQNGEDGILREIFARLKIDRGIFCEFGAWDGKHLSNTYALFEQGWGGWYIEGDARRYEDLVHNIVSPHVENIRAFVATEGALSLDNLLRQSNLFASGACRALDLLSIDIDSDDLAIWKSIKEFRSKVVVIEYNPTIPIDVYFQNPPGRTFGNSARSIFEFARSQSYALVAATGSNLIFVDQTLPDFPFVALDISDPALPLGQRYFFGMDGTLIMQAVGKSAVMSALEILRVPWNNARFGQPVDKLFRHYDPGKRTRTIGRIWSYFKLFITKPGAMMLRVLDFSKGP
jgi:hypothetical protein